MALYNAQEVVNSVLAEAELDRPICERQTVLGSRRVQTVCLTVRERRDLETALGQVNRRLSSAPASDTGTGAGRRPRAARNPTPKSPPP